MFIYKVNDDSTTPDKVTSLQFFHKHLGRFDSSSVDP